MSLSKSTALPFFLAVGKTIGYKFHIMLVHASHPWKKHTQMKMGRVIYIYIFEVWTTECELFETERLIFVFDKIYVQESLLKFILYDS